MASIQGVSPVQISSLDNANISIVGEGFTTAVAVYFVDPSTSAKVFARSFTIVSDKQINTVVPSISTGQIRVHVVTGGTDATVPAEAKQGFGIGNTIFYSDRVQLA